MPPFHPPSSPRSTDQQAWQPRLLDRARSLEEIPTPALILDLDAMERNLNNMASFLEQRGVGCRPHAKTHKCPIIARRQLELGAVGICCAKVSEAEVMVKAGIDRILITSPVVTEDKIERVMALAIDRSGIALVVDNATTAGDLSRAARAVGTELGVLIDLDVGTRRTGITPGQPALDLALEIDRLPALRLEGLQAYAGHLMHVKGHDDRKQRSQTALAKAAETRSMLEQAGLEVAVLTGGGTGTFDIDSTESRLTDLQVGSYLFMDVEYREIGSATGPRLDVFEPSLFVLTTAISQPVPALITVDAGYKALASDTVEPQLREIDGVNYHWGGDEHGILQLESASRPIELGDRILLLVPHCDPTVNLYDFYHVLRDGKVAELWPIAARGCSQ